MRGPPEAPATEQGCAAALGLLPPFAAKVRASALQRLPTVAAEGWVHGAWRKAVIGSPSSTAASMTGIERVAVIQTGSPQVALPTRGRMSAARRVELTLSTRSVHPEDLVISLSIKRRLKKVFAAEEELGANSVCTKFTYFFLTGTPVCDGNVCSSIIRTETAGPEQPPP